MGDVIRYQKRVVEKIKTLSDSRLKAALDFIEYLEEKEDWEATWEVLRDKESLENIKAADNAWESRRLDEFIPWEKERKDVQNSPAQ